MTALLVVAVTAFAGVAFAGADTAGEPPSVETGYADPVGETAVVAAADLTGLGDADEATVGVQYRADGTDDWQARNLTVAETGTVTFELSDLDSGVTYEYRAVARTANGTDTGDVRTFTTPEDDPVVTTDGAASVTDDAATFSGALTDLGGAANATVAFEYRPVGDDDVKTTGDETLAAADEFAIQADDLAAGTEYEFRAVATASDGDTAIGEWLTVTTEDAFAVATGDAEDVTRTSATLTGEVTDFGGADTADPAIEYREDGADDWETVDAALADDGTFAVTVDDLDPDTEYEYRATATASDADADTGDVRTVRTDGGLRVETTDADDVETDSATLRADVTALGGADEATVTFEYRADGADDWTETDGESVDETGTVSESVDDLDPDTTYEYRAVVDAADGDRAVGETETFTTDEADEDDDAPTVAALDAADASPPNVHVDLRVAWNVSDDGGDLENVTVTVHDEDGDVVVSETRSVDGDTAADTLTERVKHAAGETFTVTVTVTDDDGETTSDETALETDRDGRGPPEHAGPPGHAGPPAHAGPPGQR